MTTSELEMGDYFDWLARAASWRKVGDNTTVITRFRIVLLNVAAVNYFFLACSSPAWPAAVVEANDAASNLGLSGSGS